MSADVAVYSLRQKQRQERLELILQAAEQVYIEKGYRETSMDEIAARVGIATATIYAHFANKEALMVAAILERNFQRIVVDVNEICVGEGNATEKLTRIFSFLVQSDFFRRRVQIFYAMGDTPQAEHAMQRYRSAMQETSHAFTDMLAQVVEQGKADGEFDPTIATPIMLKGLIGLIRAQSVSDQLLHPYEVPANALLHVYLHGMARH